jgi:hypothetical protein
VTSKDTISLAVWDVPQPAVLGEAYAIKVGANCSSGRAPAGLRVEVCDLAGAILASGALGTMLHEGSAALLWTDLEMPPPVAAGVADFIVRVAEGDALPLRFSVAAAAKPEHSLSVIVTERDSGVALSGVEIRLGPFRARTGKDGRAMLRAGHGEHRLHLWRTAHIAEPQIVAIEGDAELRLTMLHVPEEHPDARWVR